MSSLTHYDDNVSIDDVIDLNKDYSSSDGRSTSQQHYRISLHSIDDDELRLFRRDLVTPAPSVCGGDDADVIKRNMIRSRFVPPSRIQRPVSRGESVMLFKKINNGDEDVSFDDLVSSELRDFLDTDFMMDGILSRPVSRTTIDKNASKIQDINRFRSSVSNNNEHQQHQRNQRTMLPLKLRSLSLSKSNPREIQVQEKSRNQRILPSVPESPRNGSHHRQFHHPHRTPIAAAASAAVVPNNRDDYLYKQIPKKPVTMIPKQTPLSRDKHAAKPSQAHKSIYTPAVPVPTSSRQKASEQISKPARNYGRKFPEPVVEQPVTPRFAPRKFIVPQRSTYNNDYLGRTRSDTTTTTTSSSSEDEPNEEPIMATHHRSYSSSTAATPLTFDHYNNNSPVFHRYNKTMEYKSLSSPRLRTMSSHKTFPTTVNSSNYSTATATTTTINTTTTTSTNDDAGVIDSAKQVLANIRERRKRSMMINGSS